MLFRSERHFKGAKALDSSSPNYLSSLILADTRRDPERPWEYNSEDEKEGSDDEEHLKGDSFFLLSMRELPTLLPNQGKVVFPTVRKRMYDLCQTGMQLEIKHNYEEDDAELGHFKNPDADDVIKHHNMLTKRKNRVGALSKGYLDRHFKGAKALDSSSPN